MSGNARSEMHGASVDNKPKRVGIRSRFATEGGSIMFSRQSVKGSAAGALGVLLLLASSAPLLGQAAAAASAPIDAAAAHHRRDATEYVEARISELHKKLRITTEQEPQFKAYADVMRSNAGAMQALFQERAQSTGPSGTDNASNRLHWYAKLTAAHAEAVAKLVPAFDALYQSLSDQQKKIADETFERLRQRRAPHRTG